MNLSLNRLLGGLLIVAGLTGLALGELWAPRSMELIAGHPTEAVTGLLIPFWPVVIIMIGAVLYTRRD